MKLIIGIYLLVGRPVFALASLETCPTIWNLPKFLEEPRNQADIGWCYAYAAADLLSAYSGVELSSADIAISFNEGEMVQSHRSMRTAEIGVRRKPIRDDGGQSVIALIRSIAEKGGVCAEKDFPSSVITRAVDDPTMKMTKIRRSTVFGRLSAALRVGRSDETSIRCADGNADGAFPYVSLKELPEVLEKFNEYEGDSDHSAKLAAVASLNCRDRRIPAPFSYRSIKSQRLNRHGLDQMLAEGKVAAVGLSTKPYLEKLTKEEEEKYRGDRFGLEDKSSHHAMLLVGQKWNSTSSRCEYIFKNSVGDKTNKDEGRVRGYQFVDREQFNEDKTGNITSITRPPNWKPSQLPKYLN